MTFLTVRSGAASHGRRTGSAGALHALMHAFFAIAAASLLAIVSAPIASAHDFLVTSNPAANSSITTNPKNVTLTFDDLVLTSPARPVVTIVGPDHKHYETACASAVGRTVTTASNLGPNGRYTVTWRIVSADGHPVSNSITFTYHGSGAGSAGSSKGPACEKSQGSSSKTSSMAAPLAVVGCVVVLAPVTAAILVRRSRASTRYSTEEDDDLDEPTSLDK